VAKSAHVVMQYGWKKWKENVQKSKHKSSLSARKVGEKAPLWEMKVAAS